MGADDGRSARVKKALGLRHKVGLFPQGIKHVMGEVDGIVDGVGGARAELCNEQLVRVTTNVEPQGAQNVAGARGDEFGARHGLDQVGAGGGVEQLGEVGGKVGCGGVRLRSSFMKQEQGDIGGG